MNELKNKESVSSSFRDPNGFVFCRNKIIYRQINYSYKVNYEFLLSSGLYKDLIDVNLLISHTEAQIDGSEPSTAYKVIQPEPIEFISYPYEWSFSQLKDAALITLEIQKRALNFGMSLKDCSAYNIQFKKGKPIFIDTLSFEKYREGHPWVAYRQFCQHFLAPLALMSYKDVRLNKLLQTNIDGIPLDLASSLLQYRTKFVFSLLIHIHLHSRAQKYYSDKSVKKSKNQLTRFSFNGLINSLESSIKRLTWKPQGTEWGDYYKGTNYSSESFLHKKKIVSEFISKINPEKIWDFGANIGVFSRIAAKKTIGVVSFDIDSATVEKNYLSCREEKEENILPLEFDLTNPSPGIGWENKERKSLIERGPVDTVFALALIHHLAISNNLPIVKIADFFNKICFSLIIEFVPKEDSQVEKLLSTREDVFPDYNKQAFEYEFKKYFILLDSIIVNGSKRTLYLMKNKLCKN